MRSVPVRARSDTTASISTNLCIVALFPGTSAASASATSGGGDASDRKMPMIPAGSDHASKTCHLCQEPISIVWDDEADEWMYKDAIYRTAKEGGSKEVVQRRPRDMLTDLSDVDNSCLLCWQVAGHCAT